MLVEKVKVSPMFENPLKIRHLNVQKSLIAISRCNAVKKLPRRRDVLKNMPESEKITSLVGVRTKERLSDIGTTALIGIVVSNYIEFFLP